MFADRQPHHPVHFPPQGVIKDHLELGWDGQSRYGHNRPSANPHPRVQQGPWVSQASTWCIGPRPAPASLSPQISCPRVFSNQLSPSAAPPFHLAQRFLRFSFHPPPTGPAPGPASPAPGRLTLSAVWVSGQMLMLSLRQKAKSSLEPLRCASALLMRIWGGA